jgi:hypothetical protein
MKRVDENQAREMILRRTFRNGPCRASVREGSGKPHARE